MIWWGRLKRRRKVKDSLESEIERLTSELIAETTGPEGSLQEAFDQMTKDFDAETNPLGEEKAREILTTLIQDAAAGRQRLIDRIEKSVETGMLFDRYYSQMAKINRETNRTYAKMKKSQALEERYEYQRTIYKKITDKVYEPNVIPGDRPNRRGKKHDIWKLIKEAAGGRADEVDE